MACFFRVLSLHNTLFTVSEQPLLQEQVSVFRVVWCQSRCLVGMEQEGVSPVPIRSLDVPAIHTSAKWWLSSCGIGDQRGRQH